MATSIDSNASLINNYNVSATSPVDKPESEIALQKVSDKYSSESEITDQLQSYERILTHSIDNASSGIALAKIAQEGLKEQQNILANIKQLVIQSSKEELDENNKMILAQEINKMLQNYESVGDATSYNGESLLKTEGDASDDLSIVSEDKIIPINKVDTLKISSALREFLGDFINNSGLEDKMLNRLEQSMNQLTAFSNQFENGSNELETMVKAQLTEAAKIANVDIDFGKEVVDFSKSNLLSQLGYLMQTQANAHTQRTIQILK